MRKTDVSENVVNELDFPIGLITSTLVGFFFFPLISNYLASGEGLLRLDFHFSSFQWMYSLNKHLMMKEGGVGVP